MNARIRLVTTILFDCLGVHQFIDEQSLQGLLYIFILLFLKKKQFYKIEKTSKTLGIVFAVISFLHGFGSIGTDGF